MRLPRFDRLMALPLALCALFCQAMPASAADAPEKPARMLMVTTSKTFTHDPVRRKEQALAPSEVAVTQIGQQTKLFTVDCTQNPVADFTPDNLKKYDLVFFYTQGPNLEIPEPALDYFFNTWLKQKGHGFIATHSSTDTYGDYKPYWDMIGGTFDGHPWNAGDTVTITVHDKNHPSTKVWGDEFQIRDEIYQYKNWQPGKVHVLMSLNMAKCGTKKPYHVPVSWIKNYGDGRVFYTNLGHNAETWANPKFRESLIGGIRWVMGLEEGDATPNPEVSKAWHDKSVADAEGK